MAGRTVQCAKFGEEMEGLDAPPFPGDVGQKIYERVSKQAWEMWRDDIQMKVLNEYRLNMGDPKDYNLLVEQMLAFLNLKEGEILETENEERGRQGE